MVCELANIKLNVVNLLASSFRQGFCNKHGPIHRLEINTANVIPCASKDCPLASIK